MATIDKNEIFSDNFLMIEETEFYIDDNGDEQPINIDHDNLADLDYLAKKSKRMGMTT